MLACPAYGGRRTTYDGFGFALADDRRPRADDCSLQIRHLNRRQRRVESLVAHLQARAIDGLLQRVTGENTECVGDAGFLCRLANPACDFVDDDVIMRGVSTQQAAETDDGVVFASFGERARGGGNLERAGNANNIDVSILRAGADQSVVCASQQAIGDEFIEACDDDAEAEPRGVELSRTRFQPNFGFGGFLRVSVSLW